MMLSMQSFAQSNWYISVANEQDAPVGYVYKQEVIGISTRDKITRKARSALSLSCSIKQGSDHTVQIIIQWENMQGSGPQYVNYSIDGKSTADGAKWLMTQDRDMLYRSADNSYELLQAIKQGRTLTFDWSGFDQTRYLTTFNISTFRSNLSEFNRKCSTKV